MPKSAGVNRLGRLHDGGEALGVIIRHGGNTLRSSSMFASFSALMNWL
jgi:L-asparaginase/Glu-tRNA(Gln) amidotransferase subunit D